MKKIMAAVGAAATTLALAACSFTVPDVTLPSPGTTCTVATTGTGGSWDCPTPAPTSAEPTPSATTGAPSPTPTSASPSPTPTSASPTPPVESFPTPATTGVPAGTTLTDTTDCFVESGTTVTGRRFLCDKVEMGAGATIRNSEVRGGVKGDNGFTIEDSSILSGVACNGEAAIGNGMFTARRLEIVGWGDAFRVEGGLNGTVIEDSYMKLCETSTTHGDGLQGYIAGDDTVFRHNTVDQPSGNALDGVTANVFWSDGSGDRLTVHNNLLMGGGYTIRVMTGASHMVTDNRVVIDSWRTSPWVGGPLDKDHICANGQPAPGHTVAGNRLVTIDANYNVTSTGAAFGC